ncbi:MAG: magnesium chelatase domain-containing protein [Dongiaceae bacterium]
MRGALHAIGQALPVKRIINNLAPTDPGGSHFDMPISRALLALILMGVLPKEELARFSALEVLGLDGTLAPVAGVLPPGRSRPRLIAKRAELAGLVGHRRRGRRAPAAYRRGADLPADRAGAVSRGCALTPAADGPTRSRGSAPAHLPGSGGGRAGRPSAGPG